MDIDRYPKDPQLEGFYVKRCKCGARPYMDRICIGGEPKWLKCDFCHKETDSDSDKQVAIDNWNNEKITSYDY